MAIMLTPAWLSEAHLYIISLPVHFRLSDGSKVRFAELACVALQNRVHYQWVATMEIVKMCALLFQDPHVHLPQPASEMVRHQAEAAVAEPGRHDQRERPLCMDTPLQAAEDARALDRRRLWARQRAGGVAFGDVIYQRSRKSVCKPLLDPCMQYCIL